MYQEIVLTEHPYDDMRGAMEYAMDHWVDSGHNLLNHELFTMPEILSLFQ